jgi:flagella basal body P-ring formation protein FlgA
MHRNLSNPYTALISLAILLAYCGVAHAAEIRLRADARTSNSIVRLADVAEITAADAEEARELAAIELGPAPANKQTLRAREIHDRLALAGINPARHRFSGASLVAVTNSARNENKTRPNPKSTERVTPQKPANEPPSTEVIVALAEINRGDRIRAEHLTVERVKGSVQRAAFQSIEDIVGMEATRNITPGQPIDEQYVRTPRLVKRGDVVDVISRSGGVQVRTKGRAREEGGDGDLINIELLSDRRALLARVSGLQQVEITATSAAVSN